MIKTSQLQATWVETDAVLEVAGVTEAVTEKGVNDDEGECLVAVAAAKIETGAVTISVGCGGE